MLWDLEDQEGMPALSWREEVGKLPKSAQLPLNACPCLRQQESLN